MITGVQVDSHGACALKSITKKQNQYMLSNSLLHTHYRDDNFQLISTFSVEDLITRDIPLLNFSFPPPLNSYIYPENIIVLKMSNKTAKNLSCEELKDYCAQFKKNMFEIKTELAIYDVPLDEAIYDDEVSDIEEEDVNNSDDEEDDIDDDDDSWEEDETPVV